MPAAFALWLGAALLLPQDVPTVSHLGPRPAAAAAFAVPLPAELPQPLAADVLLTVPAALPWGDVEMALRRLATHGAKLVHFAAALPDGTQGAVVLALPEAPDVPVSLVLRAHRQRSGVPVDSVRVVLSRLLADLEPERAGCVPLALEVPADARCEQVLRLLVACVDGGAKRLVLRAGPPAGKFDERGALALDVDGPVRLQVVAQNPPPARPTQAATPFGALLPPPNVAPEPQLGGGAGGRFGARGGGNRALAGGCSGPAAVRSRMPRAAIGSVIRCSRPVASRSSSGARSTRPNWSASRRAKASMPARSRSRRRCRSSWRRRGGRWRSRTACASPVSCADHAGARPRCVAPHGTSMRRPLLNAASGVSLPSSACAT